MQDDVVALFAYDRWANRKVLDACRKLTAEQYVAEPVPGWSSVRSTIYHIALATEFNLRTLGGGPEDSIPPEAALATVDDVAQLLERAYRRFEELRPTLTPEWLNTVLTLRAIGRSFTLPRWAILRHIGIHSAYHRGQVASKLKRFGIEQEITDFFWWVIEQVPQEASIATVHGKAFALPPSALASVEIAVRSTVTPAICALGLDSEERSERMAGP